MEKKLVLQQLLTHKQGKVPISFWHHFSAASGIDLDGYRHPEIMEDNVRKTRQFVEDVHPDFVKLMSDGLFNYDFNQPLDNPSTIYEGIEPINAQHPWIIETRKLVTNQKRVIGNRLGFYNIFSPTTLLKWALSKHPDGTHDKTTADELLVKAIIEDRASVAKALDVITRDVIMQATVAIKAGADGIYYSTQAIQDDRVDHGLFSELVEKNDRAVIRAVNKLSDTNILHICGNRGARNKLGWFANYENSVVNWSTDVENTSLEEGKEIFQNKVVLGGLGNTTADVLYQGNQVEIAREIKRLIKNAGTENVILSANCTVPRDIDIQHLRWAVSAVKN
ncbi:MAG: uroporphyrinogen III decarboxylase [Lactobacillus sp.]|nr:uroporphyrinogen III decarboxylase [Lactobacillus sp.]